jgi:hypothetical protein
MPGKTYLEENFQAFLNFELKIRINEKIIVNKMSKSVSSHKL